jgi:anhydro-N-acetylmuramic acid kinase
MTKMRRFQQTLNSQTRTIIGLMSGMSMDGVDLALAKCSGDYPDFTVELIGASYRPYPVALKARIKQGRAADAEEVAKLNIIVASEFAACVNDFLTENSISPEKIDAIGSHGQTIFHATSSGSHPPSTLQVGAPSLIAELTGITTVGNFRLRDIAVGGQGAPLVALADHVLNRDESRPTGLLNLGSIANITVLTKNFLDIIAFDLGPANMPIDYFAAMRSLNGIDENGSISMQGRVIAPLLNSLLQLSYFKESPPKAAGYGEFGPAILDKICQPYLKSPLPDLLCTAVEFSAQTISNGLHTYVLPSHPELKNIMVSGGGIYNNTLMQRIRDLLPDLVIEPLNDRYADAKEALAFAILAHTTLSGLPGNIPNATGATKAVILGEIAV